MDVVGKFHEHLQGSNPYLSGGKWQNRSKGLNFGHEIYIRYLLNTNATFELGSSRNFITLSGFLLTQQSAGQNTLLCCQVVGVEQISISKFDAINSSKLKPLHASLSFTRLILITSYNFACCSPVVYSSTLTCTSRKPTHTPLRYARKVRVTVAFMI